MWITDIQTVYCYILSHGTFSNRNVLRDFSTQEKKKNEKRKQWNKTSVSLRRWKRWKKKKKNRNTKRHEQAFIVLCIYAIIYVWIWRIWKYMLTNLYRVFYVMWNTWNRCSLLSGSPSLSLFFCLLVFSLFCSKRHIRKTSMIFLKILFWKSRHIWDLRFRSEIEDDSWRRWLCFIPADWGRNVLQVTGQQNTIS